MCCYSGLVWADRIHLYHQLAHNGSSKTDFSDFADFLVGICTPVNIETSQISRAIRCMVRPEHFIVQNQRFLSFFMVEL